MIVITRPAVVVIDMLRDFLEEDGVLYCKKCRDILPNMKKLIEVARSKSIPVVYVSCSHHLGGKSGDLVKWPPHAIEGTKGAEIVDELKPQDGDYVVHKETYSGFFKTDLEKTLRSLGVDTVIITGIHTHVCILASGLDAFYRGFKVIFPEDCITTGNEENHKTRLRFFRSHLGEVTTLAKLVSDLIEARIETH